MRIKAFNGRGFEIIDKLIDEPAINYLKSELSKISAEVDTKQREFVPFGVRNLLNAVPAIRDFSTSAVIRSLIEPIAGKRARVIKAIYFDKTPEANWKVPFHQDLTITVKERKDSDGFLSWTTKAGIIHVQPPVSVLENIVALRIHLDDADESNGALRVIPGSHRFGRLRASQIKEFKTAREIVTCPVAKGGAMLMRPLLLHASSAATKARHRRVIHFEFSAVNLPEGLNWFGS